MTDVNRTETANGPHRSTRLPKEIRTSEIGGPIVVTKLSRKWSLLSPKRPSETTRPESNRERGTKAQACKPVNIRSHPNTQVDLEEIVRPAGPGLAQRVGKGPAAKGSGPKGLPNTAVPEKGQRKFPGCFIALKEDGRQEVERKSMSAEPNTPRTKGRGRARRAVEINYVKGKKGGQRKANNKIFLFCFGNKCFGKELFARRCGTHTRTGPATSQVAPND